MFLAALAFASGIPAANFLWRSPFIWMAAFCVAVAAGALSLRRSPQLAFFCALLAVAPLGGLYLQARDAAQPTIVADLQPFGTGEDEVDVTAHVIREGIIRDSPYGGRQESVDVESEELRLGDHLMREPAGIRLTIYSKQSEEQDAQENGSESPLQVYTYGERLRLTAKLRLPRNYRNPGAMDLAGYLALQGIRLTGSARASNVEILPGFAGSRLGLWRSRARRSALEQIHSLWPGENGALMQAALIGGRAFFGREIKSDFQRTGTYHILVVSGINVGILAFAVFWLLRTLPFGETWATVLTIVLSWGYAFVADLGSPIVRATITLNIYLLTRLLFRDRAGLNALGIAALGILLVNPRALFEASFQLTFLSVIAVAGIAVPILRRTLYALQSGLRNLDSPEWDYVQPSRAAEFRVIMRLLRDTLTDFVRPRIADWLTVYPARFLLAAVELLFISVVINLALALPMAWYFHRATTMALPANALVHPNRVRIAAECGACCRTIVRFAMAGIHSGEGRRLRSRNAHRNGSPHWALPYLRRARAHADAHRLDLRRTDIRFGFAAGAQKKTRHPGRCRTARFRGVDRSLPSPAAASIPGSLRSSPSTLGKAIPCC